MGGHGSGRPPLSDAEKKARGTLRPGRSEADYLAKAAEKVIVGPWLKTIPEPTTPLNATGRKHYDSLTKLLFEQNKLTMATVMLASIISLHWQNIQARVDSGKEPTTDSLKQVASLTRQLQIAENAPAIANPDQRNRFEGSGFANSRTSPIRLRSSSSAR